MKVVIGMGSICFIDKQNNERFIPISIDDKTGLDYFDTKDAWYADLALVGDEQVHNDCRTTNEYWRDIKELVKE